METGGQRKDGDGRPTKGWRPVSGSQDAGEATPGNISVFFATTAGLGDVSRKSSLTAGQHVDR